MDNVRILELRPVDGRKSFYGKARAAFRVDLNTWYLLSYDTVVCSYNMNSGLFFRHWAGYSVTTMRHINAFLNALGLPDNRTKSWWLSLPMWEGVKPW